MKKTKQSQGKGDRISIGWRENVSLPELGIPSIRAKIDTGARTSALHAIDIEPFERDGELWVEFHSVLPHSPRKNRCAARVLDQREIKNTSGIAEMRYVITTTLLLGSRHWHIELSLADRGNMGFDLILGRTAIRRHAIVVDPGRSFLAGPPMVLRGKVASAE